MDEKRAWPPVQSPDQTHLTALEARPVWIVDVDRDRIAWANPSAVARSDAETLIQLISRPLTDDETALEPLAAARDRLLAAQKREAAVVLRAGPVFGAAPLDADVRLHRLRDQRFGLRISERRDRRRSGTWPAAPSLVATLGGALAGVDTCLMTVGGDGLIRTASRASHSLLGKAPVDLVGRPLAALFDTVGRRKVRLFLERGPTLSGFGFEQGLTLRLDAMSDRAAKLARVVIVGQGEPMSAGGGYAETVAIVVVTLCSPDAATSEDQMSAETSRRQSFTATPRGADAPGAGAHVAQEIGHAIRTPLTSIIGFAEQAKRNLDGNDSAALDPIDAVLAASAELTALLNAFERQPADDNPAHQDRRFPRSSAPIGSQSEVGEEISSDASEPAALSKQPRTPRAPFARTWVDPSTLAADIVLALGPRADAVGVRVTTDFSAAPARVVAQAEPLRHALAELLTQAIIAAGAGGRVLFQAASWESDGVAIEIVDDGDGWRGLGVDADPHADLRAKPSKQHAAIRRARAAIEADGAHFEFENRPGAGATSRIVFRAERVVPAPKRSS